ncbi:MAG: tellurite resistance TerB family protein [Candidatus Kariarchaeaceae archaeon]|jgi:tellurite resistance protein
MTKKTLFEQTMLDLMKAAKKDGIITPEELDIIEQVKIDADAYLVMLQEAFMDGVVTEAETEKLKELKQTILDRAELVAKVDGSFDEDEEQLLKKLSEIISKQYI